jgi:phosphoenolpyruvate synthase/pyruvate phosphate dikinase
LIFAGFRRFCLGEALTATEIAETAQFFSFGTNDLPQTCLGMSRDDSGSFLPAYTELEIVKTNPFASIDQTRVGHARVGAFTAFATPLVPER